MIGEVDAALEALVRRDAINGARVEILFDAPTKDWVARRNSPAIDLYLYDIREDLPRRQTVMEPVRDASTGFVTEHRMPARRYRLSYLVTAWTQRPEDEHRLLSTCLATFVRNEFIPFDLVGGSLAQSAYPVLLLVCQPPPQDRTIADVWSALGGELKPSLDLVATAPLDPSWTEPAAKPVLETPRIGIGGPGMEAESFALGGALAGGGFALRGGGRGGRPIGPGDEALQEEYVGGALSDARQAAGGTAAAGGTSRRGKGSRRTADEEGPEVAVAPTLEDLGGGRIVRVRGVPRP